MARVFLNKVHPLRIVWHVEQPLYAQSGFQFPTAGISLGIFVLARRQTHKREVAKTDLSVGVLTVLYKGPCLIPCSVDAAGQHFILYSRVLGDLTLKNIV
jgi:hypothetical protein